MQLGKDICVPGMADAHFLSQPMAETFLRVVVDEGPDDVDALRTQLVPEDVLRFTGQVDDLGVLEHFRQGLVRDAGKVPVLVAVNEISHDSNNFCTRESQFDCDSSIDTIKADAMDANLDFSGHFASP